MGMIQIQLLSTLEKKKEREITLLEQSLYPEADLILKRLAGSVQSIRWRCSLQRPVTLLVASGCWRRRLAELLPVAATCYSDGLVADGDGSDGVRDCWVLLPTGFRRGLICVVVGAMGYWWRGQREEVLWMATLGTVGGRLGMVECDSGGSPSG
ncbi:hypothetical protein Dimus_017125 [Dionaea muscipula]